VTDGKVGKRFGQTVSEFTDPDGMGLALVGVEGAESEQAWSNGEVPPSTPSAASTARP
jgi:glyoxalase family protein